jgi:large subunit ribosomal protein L18
MFMAKATGPTYKVSFRRRRTNLTNYRKRLALLKSGKPRMVVRKTNRQVIVQFVNFTNDHDETIASATSNELSQFNWKPSTNLPSSYLTAYLCANKAKKKGVKSAVLDSGLHTPSKGSFLFAAAKGARDAGIERYFLKGRSNFAIVYLRVNRIKKRIFFKKWKYWKTS